MEGARMVPRDISTLEMLRQLERKVLWLSSYMIHHANHEVDRGDGLKVGGHVTWSADDKQLTFHEFAGTGARAAASS
jgi:pyruvate dehydrogenase complex dehydrogenase (E1) component